MSKNLFKDYENEKTYRPTGDGDDEPSVTRTSKIVEKIINYHHLSEKDMDHIFQDAQFL